MYTTRLHEDICKHAYLSVYIVILVGVLPGCGLLDPLAFSPTCSDLGRYQIATLFSPAGAGETILRLSLVLQQDHQWNHENIRVTRNLFCLSLVGC